MNRKDLVLYKYAVLYLSGYGVGNVNSCVPEFDFVSLCLKRHPYAMCLKDCVLEHYLEEY